MLFPLSSTQPCVWDKRGPPSQPRAAACPSSPPWAPTFEAPPFSPSFLPRLLLPRDKLSGLPPEWDRVKFRSNSAPSSSAREGTVRHTLITAGVWALMGDLGQVGGQPLAPHQEGPHSREDSPSSPTPCKPKVLALKRGLSRQPPGWPQGSGGGGFLVVFLGGLQPHSWLFRHIF